MHRLRFAAGLAGSLVAAALLALLVQGSWPADVAHAEAPLPYVAYGTGVGAGQVVEALVADAVVARTTADAKGRWKLTIEPGSAADGDTVTFHLDGAATGRSIVFRGGHFPPPPGIALTGSTATATPSAPRATPTASAGHPAATSTPKSGCTKAGRPIPCAAGRAPKR